MHRIWNVSPISVAGLALASCVSWGWFAPEDFFAVYGLPAEPAAEGVTLCHAYNCQRQTQVDLRPAWPQIESAFTQAMTPQQERDAMAQAVALAERAAGPVLGTSDDPGGVLNAAWSGNPAYQDCVDEAANTTTLLVLIANNGLLNHHTVEPPSIRGAFIDGRWQHYTAVVRETATGAKFAVDSWFRANGEPAVVMDFEAWYTGYGIPDEAA